MKKNMLTVLVLALVVVNIVLTAIMMISTTSTNQKTAKLIDNIATAMELELTNPGASQAGAAGAANVSIEDTEMYSFTEDFTIPLTIGEDGTQHYMVCKVALSINKNHEDYKKKGALVASSDPLLRDTLISVVGSHTMEEIRADQDGLRNELLSAIQQQFGSSMIFRVSITDMQFG